MQDHGDTYDPEHFWFSETRTLFTCVMFLTRLPCPAFTDHHPAFLMRSMLYFPVVGLVIGAWAATWFQAASVFWNPTISAAVSTMASVWLTGTLLPFHRTASVACERRSPHALRESLTSRGGSHNTLRNAHRHARRRHGAHLGSCGVCRCRDLHASSSLTFRFVSRTTAQTVRRVMTAERSDG